MKFTENVINSSKVRSPPVDIRQIKTSREAPYLMLVVHASISLTCFSGSSILLTV